MMQPVVAESTIGEEFYAWVARLEEPGPQSAADNAHPPFIADEAEAPLLRAAKQSFPVKAPWERQPAPMWDLVTGLAFCRELELAMAGAGHAALGGSVMYRGYSEKDLDIVIRSNDRVRARTVVNELMSKKGYRRRNPEYVGESGKPHPAGSIDVWLDGGAFRADNPLRRVDIFWTKLDA